ncbi:hypothetical protein BST97_04315 [Nonlabens spongiae]|uniref:HPr kinase/phosphorylase C-terminal domain-containing protein n=1 Tax=Nonlabens spongiae TaxID=331648 RepID=A0A1W6MIE2_9FLAO|nr:hypothetical protein [Nonlabens spongiae]ARN77266.1 hypothetical protein BST97_04315 [Nonlabens spongiae]
MILFKALGDQTIVWFSKANQYLILDRLTAEILRGLEKGVGISELFDCIGDVPLSRKRFQEHATQVQTNIFEVLKDGFIEEDIVSEEFDFEAQVYKTKKLYQIGSLSFEIHFSSERDFLLIHPKFAHLEVSRESEIQQLHQIKCAYQDRFYHLEIDDRYEGRWDYENLHFLIGRLYMRILERVHENREKDWGAVFHASAVGNDDSCVLMMGESGSGKSTSVALLNANGIHCLADDFVPMDKNGKIYPFPAGISIKPGSVQALSKLYPNLLDQNPIDLSAHKKQIRYIPIFNEDLRKTTKCKSLVFIKFNESVEFDMEPLSRQKLFEELIPESWISDDPAFVPYFMDWLSEIPCYSLVYSNHNKMISAVNELLEL